MKKIRYILALLPHLLLFSSAYAMKRSYPGSSSTTSTITTSSVASITAPIETYFVPQDKNVRDKLISLLENAKSRVLVAMYVITDDPIINKLVSLKRRGIDVKVIVDEIGFEGNTDAAKIFIGKLSLNEEVPLIVPLIVPSVMKTMHNKFVVIDDTHVFTGSANITNKAFNSNYENVLIINSEDIAQQYRRAFDVIENETLSFYIKMIAKDIPNKWLPYLLTKLEPEERLQQVCESLWDNYNPVEQERLKKIFDESPESKSVRRPTQRQAEALKRLGYSFTRIKKMSFEEASDIIGKGKRNE